MLLNFNEDELNQLIKNKIEENLNLDYKGSGSLSITDSKKKEIAKDVSAFANSDGGLIIYGIREFDEPTLRYLPEKIDPIDRTIISKEWLEQIINSNIQPKIPGLIIHPIPINSSTNHVVYAVSIPKSYTAHQSSDKKYYKRYNFESVAMEDYEIKDIINRTSSPELDVVFNDDNSTFDSNILTFPILLQNNSRKLGKEVKILVEFIFSPDYTIASATGFQNHSGINGGKIVYQSNNPDLKVYNGGNAHVGIFSLKFNGTVYLANIIVKIFCEDMYTITRSFEIAIIDGKPFFQIKDQG